MNSPKTTVAGYITLAGTILVLLGEHLPDEGWAKILHAIGLALVGGGAAGGLKMAKDDH